MHNHPRSTEAHRRFARVCMCIHVVPYKTDLTVKKTDAENAFYSSTTVVFLPRHPASSTPSQVTHTYDRKPAVLQRLIMNAIYLGLAGSVHHPQRIADRRVALRYCVSTSHSHRLFSVVPGSVESDFFCATWISPQVVWCE